MIPGKICGITLGQSTLAANNIDKSIIIICTKNHFIAGVDVIGGGGGGAGGAGSDKIL